MCYIIYHTAFRVCMYIIDIYYLSLYIFSNICQKLEFTAQAIEHNIQKLIRRIGTHERKYKLTARYTSTYYE